MAHRLAYMSAGMLIDVPVMPTQRELGDLVRLGTPTHSLNVSTDLWDRLARDPAHPIVFIAV
eukprot:30145-Eustigmatos_ZCMA.PRE.1